MNLSSVIVRLFVFFVASLILFVAALNLPFSVSAQSTYTFCASEGGVCAFTGTREVRYGGNGVYFYKTLSNGTACTNSVFGDPVAGTAKQCALGVPSAPPPPPPSSWTFCAPEGGVCAFTGTTEVRYGGNGVYFYKTLSNGTACTNSVFGDPVAGTAKQCAIGASSAPPPPPPPPPSSWTFCAPEGGVCAFTGTTEVRYGGNGVYFYKTLSNGTACTNSVFGDPVAGTAKQCAIGSASPTPAPTPPPPPPTASLVGPQSTITCPAGSLGIFPGIDIQGIVNLNPGNTTFCLRAGIHTRRSSITPKTGNTFVGEYGAILDGTGWTTTDTTQAAFRAHNENIDNVTIRNLVIRKMPQKGIHAFYWMSPDNWTIENNEIASNHTGVLFPNRSIIRNNYIHHNAGSNPSSSNAAERGGGYVGYSSNDTILEGNEIAYNGREQKVTDSVNITFRNNFVHHNLGDGIWYDSGNPGTLVEGNRVEDNGRNGVFYEAGFGNIIRNNTVRRSGDTGVFVSTSQNAQIHNNTLENNFRSIVYFINCGALTDGRGLDLKNNSARDNIVRIGTQSGAFGNGFSYTGDCTSAQVTTYLNGSKNLTFSRNTYYVPSLSGGYWLWNGLRPWADWKSFGHDLDGAVAP